MTVTGPIAPADLGLTLPHEHVIVDFIGADKISRDRYEVDDAFGTALPHLRRFRDAGGRTLVECTPAYIGRDPALLRRLSIAAGVQILTNTGYYGAVGNKYLPPQAHTETADQLAERWLREWREGIEQTGVRPGFIKLGVERGRLPELHAKLIRAAARVHLQSGLTIAVHTGDGESALDQLRVLREQGVAPGAWIWVHAQNDPGPVHLEAAGQGGWVSLDGVNRQTLDPYLKALLNLKRHGFLDRVLISQDDGWSIEGKPSGQNLKLFGNGNEAPYQTVLTHLVPKLRDAGFSPEETHRLLVDNPRRAFTIQVRKA